MLYGLQHSVNYNSFRSTSRWHDDILVTLKLLLSMSLTTTTIMQRNCTRRNNTAAFTMRSLNNVQTRFSCMEKLQEGKWQPNRLWDIHWHHILNAWPNSWRHQSLSPVWNQCSVNDTSIRNNWERDKTEGTLKRGTGKGGTGKPGTKLLGWKRLDWKMRDHVARVENAGLENLKGVDSVTIVDSFWVGFRCYNVTLQRKRKKDTAFLDLYWRYWAVVRCLIVYKSRDENREVHFGYEVR